MSKTRKNGWSKQQPGAHQRTLMLKRCGKKCFLGPNKSFPICSKNTCKINKKDNGNIKRFLLRLLRYCIKKSFICFYFLTTI